MKPAEFFAALTAAGWTVDEHATGARCTDPQGRSFNYKGVQAVQFGTWLDEQTMLEVRLPQHPLNYADSAYLLGNETDVFNDEGFLNTTAVIRGHAFNVTAPLEAPTEWAFRPDDNAMVMSNIEKLTALSSGQIRETVATALARALEA